MLAGLLVSLVAAACVLPGSAFAVELRSVTEAFGPDGTSGTSFESPASLSFDQGNKRLYVLDQVEQKIHGFDSSTPATHTPLGGNFPLAAPAAGFLDDIAADSSSHNLYYASEGGNELYGFDESGAALSGFPIGGHNFPCGTAIDSSGNVWISEGNEGKVEKYSPAGALLNTYTIGGEPCDLAFDSANNLYVGFFFGPTVKFTASSTYTDSTTIDSEFTSAMTVDRSTGELYVIHYNYIDVWSSSGEFLYELKGEGFGGEFAGIAIDEGTEELYVSDYGNHKVQVYGPAIKLQRASTENADGISGTSATLHGTVIPEELALTDCHFEYISDAEYRTSEVQKLTVSATGGGFTLTFKGKTTQNLRFDASAAEVEGALHSLGSIGGDGAKGSVAVSGGPGDEAGSTPYTITFGGTLANQDVGEIAANAIFLSGGAASVEVLTTQQGGLASYAGATSVPCEPAAASIPADSGAHAVSADVSGLKAPAATYHFRLVATSALGSTHGADRILITAPETPEVNVQSVEAVGTSDAIVSAKINPHGAQTTYHVEYGTSASYGQSTAESEPIGVATDNSDHSVSVHITGLSPGTAYHFRFVATSTAGLGEGTDTSFATYPTLPGFGSCSNDLFRTGFGSRLPDCRAYEQVTPTNKNGANAQGTTNALQASTSGDRITFYLNGGLPATGGSSRLAPFMASRGPGGWSTDGLLPLTEPRFAAFVAGWSEDLSNTVVTERGSGLSAKLYVRDSATAGFQLGASGSYLLQEAGVAGFAADTSHLIFEAYASLLPSAPAGLPNAYDLDHGVLTLVGRVPSGTATSCDDAEGAPCVPAPNGSFAGPPGGASFNFASNTISTDGSKVFFTTGTSNQLYVREDRTVTRQISASQRGISDPNGSKPATFIAATQDGSRVFFLSCEKLTDDSTAVSTAEDDCAPTPSQGQGQDLYSYDTDTDELTDLTVDSNVGDPQGAAVQGVLGASGDGSYVYFAANGVLAPGASSGNCAKTDGGGSTGSCNLYLLHGDEIAFIAPLYASNGNDNDVPNWQSFEARRSRVADDGTLLFSSGHSLTGYDNVEATGAACGDPAPKGGEPCVELFRYSPADGRLICISCNPAGFRPNGDAVLGTGRSFVYDGPRSRFLTRNLSSDGSRIFFDSRDALLPTDTNGVNDVYEWEAEGSGSCTSESQNGGCLYLLSTGTSPDPSYFADASANGVHAFLFTVQQLVSGDHDQLSDIYDAGVGAGLASQHQLAPSTCTGVACQANPPPPAEQGMSSATFTGPGNAHKPSAARKCPKGKRKVRRAGKVHCQRTSKQHKRHNNRGGSK